jgi:hypothetical protein
VTADGGGEGRAAMGTGRLARMAVVEKSGVGAAAASLVGILLA